MPQDVAGLRDVSCSLSAEKIHLHIRTSYSLFQKVHETCFGQRCSPG